MQSTTSESVSEISEKLDEVSDKLNLLVDLVRKVVDRMPTEKKLGEYQQWVADQSSSVQWVMDQGLIEKRDGRWVSTTPAPSNTPNSTPLRGPITPVPPTPPSGGWAVPPLLSTSSSPSASFNKQYQSMYEQ